MWFFFFFLLKSHYKTPLWQPWPQVCSKWVRASSLFLERSDYNSVFQCVSKELVQILVLILWDALWIKVPRSSLGNIIHCIFLSWIFIKKKNQSMKKTLRSSKVNQPTGLSIFPKYSITQPLLPPHFLSSCCCRWIELVFSGTGFGRYSFEEMGECLPLCVRDSLGAPSRTLCEGCATPLAGKFVQFQRAFREGWREINTILKKPSSSGWVTAPPPTPYSLLFGF